MRTDARRHGRGLSVAAHGASQGTRVARPLHPGTGGATRSAPNSDAESAARGESTPTTPRGDGAYPSGVPERPPFLRGMVAAGGARGEVCEERQLSAAELAHDRFSRVSLSLLLG